MEEQFRKLPPLTRRTGVGAKNLRVINVVNVHFIFRNQTIFSRPELLIAKRHA
jgi:hypothetical protein